MPPSDASADERGPSRTVTVFGTVRRDKIADLEDQSGIVRVDEDAAAIEPFDRTRDRGESSGHPGRRADRSRRAGDSSRRVRPAPVAEARTTESGRTSESPRASATADARTEGAEARELPVETGQALGVCPIPPCDCSPSEAKGTLDEVAEYVGAKRLWDAGYEGEEMVVGVVDGGITATGQTSNGEIPRVVGGWPEDDWGTTALWDRHGNMCATDVLGIAPKAELYDIRVASRTGGTKAYLSRLFHGVDWAIRKHREDGTPHVLTLSNGIYRKSLAPSYAEDPDHQVTRKIVEAIDEGILVLFAAGNCGDGCSWSDSRCGSTGPGGSIWGANGHGAVMTVGGVNIEGQFVGYSSQGPASLAEDKPDFCSVTHFKGYKESADSGTSAATPVAAGLVTLLKQADPSTTQSDLKDRLKRTATDIGPEGFDIHSGAGIVDGEKAFESRAESRWGDWEDLGGTCLHGVGVASWSAERVDAFTVGPDAELYRRAWDTDGWHDWERLGGTCVSEPAATTRGQNSLDVFVLGTDNHLFRTWWDGDEWRGWERVGGPCSEGVAATSWGEDRLDVFTVGFDNQLRHKTRDADGWGSWESLGGPCNSEPAATAWGEDSLDVFVLGTDNHLYHKWWDGSSWRGWESLGGPFVRGPAATSRSEGTLDVFAVGTDNRLYGRSWDGSWDDWEDLGGVSITAPAAVSRTPDRLDAFAVGTDSTLQHRAYGPTEE
ncbi:S8 family serine peptidase [Halorussus caseinilyticus]|uniref:S8 family serine peptidase n=1 Tax=Halorussus caseinilyticus TaxID=3034025 RepID=A0ABD5WGX1_9EURY